MARLVTSREVTDILVGGDMILGELDFGCRSTFFFDLSVLYFWMSSVVIFV